MQVVYHALRSADFIEPDSVFRNNRTYCDMKRIIHWQNIFNFNYDEPRILCPLNCKSLQTEFLTIARVSSARIVQQGVKLYCPYTRAVIVNYVYTFFQRALIKLAPKLASQIFKIHDSSFTSKMISSHLHVIFKYKTRN